MKQYGAMHRHPQASRKIQYCHAIHDADLSLTCAGPRINRSGRRLLVVTASEPT